MSHSVEFIRKHRHFISSDPDYAIQLENIFQVGFLSKDFPVNTVGSIQYFSDFRDFPLIIEMIEPCNFTWCTSDNTVFLRND